MNKDYDDGAFIPSRPLSELPELRQALKEAAAAHRHAKARQAQLSRPELSRMARDLLDAWSLEPCAPLSHLYKRIHCSSPGTQKKIRGELARRKLAEFATPRLEKSKVGLMMITDAGWELMGKLPPKLPGRGGIEHMHAAVWIQAVGKRTGYESATEWSVPPSMTHPVDVSWRVSERWRAFEICWSADNLPSHIKACLIDSDAVESVTVVTFEKRELAALRDAVEAAFPLSPILTRVRYETLQAYYHALYP